MMLRYILAQRKSKLLCYSVLWFLWLIWLKIILFYHKTNYYFLVGFLVKYMLFCKYYIEIHIWCCKYLVSVYELSKVWIKKFVYCLPLHKTIYSILSCLFKIRFNKIVESRAGDRSQKVQQKKFSSIRYEQTSFKRIIHLSENIHYIISQYHI